jgi:hypothetical protein
LAVVRNNNGHHSSVYSGIAPQLVSEKPPIFGALLFEEAMKKEFGRRLIVTTLHQNVYINPILTNGAPEKLSLPLNGNEHFIDGPHVDQPALPLFTVATMADPNLWHH